MSQSKRCLDTEDNFGAHNYHPIPVVIEKGEGVYVWDVENKKYFDFLSAYSAVNQGHCHPKIAEVMLQQAKKMCLTSRAFHNNMYPEYLEYMNKMFGYEMVLPMNTGAEAVETALKIARSWGYQKKKIPEGEAIILSVEGNFHGRTISIVGMSTDPVAQNHFGPYTPGLGPRVNIDGKEVLIKYNDSTTLEMVLDKIGDKVAAVLLEPIQGEAGVFVPDQEYFGAVAAACKKHNVLLIDDEIQTGLARTGKLLCIEHWGVRADMVLLGKALSGGFYPVSAVLADKDVMLCIQPGEHGSTYGGNPLGCAIAMASLDVIKEEKLIQRAADLGEYLMGELNNLKKKHACVRTARGKGLLCAVEIDDKGLGFNAWDVCLLMMDRGVLAKPTHDDIIRLAPPLVITKEQLAEVVAVLDGVLTDIKTMKPEDIPRRSW